MQLCHRIKQAPFNSGERLFIPISSFLSITGLNLCPYIRLDACGRCKVPIYRFALPALGRVWTLLGRRKKTKLHFAKCSLIGQTSTNQVHALLGNLPTYQNDG